MKMNRLSIIAVLAIAVSAAALFLIPKEAVGKIPYQNASAVAEGKKIYFAECASCHGANLEGQNNWQQRDVQGYLPAPPHDESGHTWHHDDQLLFQLTKYGIQSIAGNDYKSNMPAFEHSLSDEQIWNVLAYIKSQWPKDIAERHTDMFSNK